MVLPAGDARGSRGSSTASWSPGIYDNFLVKKQMLGLAGNPIQRRGQRCRVYWDIRSKNDSDCKIQIPHSHHRMECFVGLRVHGVFLQNSMDFHGFSFIFILWQSGNQTWLENPPRSSMIFPVYIYVYIYMYIYIIFIDSIDARW